MSTANAGWGAEPSASGMTYSGPGNNASKRSQNSLISTMVGNGANGTNLLPTPQASVFNQNQLGSLPPDKLSAVAMLASKMKKISPSRNLPVDGSDLDGSYRTSTSKSLKGRSSSSSALSNALFVSETSLRTMKNNGNSTTSTDGTNIASAMMMSPSQPDIMKRSSSSQKMKKSRSKKKLSKSSSSTSSKNSSLLSTGSLSTQTKANSVDASDSTNSAWHLVVTDIDDETGKALSSTTAPVPAVTGGKSPADPLDLKSPVPDRWNASPTSLTTQSLQNRSVGTHQQDQQATHKKAANETILDASPLLALAAGSLSTNTLLQLASKRGSTGSFRPSKAKLMSMSSIGSGSAAGKNATFNSNDADGSNSSSDRKPRRKLRTETMNSLGLGLPPKRSDGDELGSVSLHRTPSKSCLKKSASTNGLRRAVSMVEVTLPSKETVKKANYIKFNELVQVKRVESSSDLCENKKDLWFQQDEMREIRNKSRRIVDLLDDDVVNTKSIDARGLEEHRKEGRKLSKERIHGGWDAVLDAQDEQRFTGQYCDEEIATLSRKLSKNSLLEAQRKAKKDAKIAAKFMSSSSQ